jgi:hypothetical protein
MNITINGITYNIRNEIELIHFIALLAPAKSVRATASPTPLAVAWSG